MLDLLADETQFRFQKSPQEPPSILGTIASISAQAARNKRFTIVNSSAFHLASMATLLSLPAANSL